MNSPHYPVETITGVWKFERPPHLQVATRSTPGHLLHYIESGTYTLVTNRRRYEVNAGDCVYYYGSEEVEWHGGSLPVVFYSVGYMSSLPVLPVTRRVFKVRSEIARIFPEIFNCYQRRNEGISVHLELYGMLCRLLALIYRSDHNTGEKTQSGVWPAIEQEILHQRKFHITVGDLARLSGMSLSTLSKHCIAATGKSPRDRLRDLRISEAKGLLLYSGMSITEIAGQLGYRGIHEFSREFSRTCHVPPSGFIKNNSKAHPEKY